MSEYAGMAVNERLYAAGLLDDFGAAVTRGDKEKLIEILCSVEIDLEGASQTIKAIFADPSRYGFKCSG